MARLSPLFVLVLAPWCGATEVAARSEASASDLPKCNSIKAIWRRAQLELPEGYRHECVAEQKFDDGGWYVGEWRDNRTDGKGSWTSGDGDSYKGEFKAGKFHGVGVYVWKSGDRHEGEFRNHGILGEGLRTETDGTTRRGTFRGADLDGRGMVTRPDGSRTVGLWKGGKLQRGARTLLPVEEKAFLSAEGARACELEADLASWDGCVGALIEANGHTFTGGFRGGRPHGRGIRVVVSSGYVYGGEWKDGLFSGKRRQATENGAVYEGEWLDDQWHGIGTLTNANKDSYTGEFRAGKFHGKGTYTWADGGTLVADFSEGLVSGSGTARFANGNSYTGAYANDKFNGLGTFTWADGSRYVGGWKDGLRHGKGVWTAPRGDRVEGDFRNDVLDGNATYLYADGERYVGEWRAGKRHGVDTALTISNGRSSRAVSKLDLVRLTGSGPAPTEIGTITSARALHIELEDSFQLRAQNAAENFQLRMQVVRRIDDTVMFSRAVNKFGTLAAVSTAGRLYFPP